MASTITFARAALRSPPATSALKTAAPRRLAQQSRRGFTSSSSAAGGSKNTLLYSGLAATTLAGAALYTSNSRPTLAETPAEQEPVARGWWPWSRTSSADSNPKQADYQKVYEAIAKRLVDEDDYDDGSYGPVLLRLGWHASGTYDAATNTGGSNGATMRFAPEGDHGANAGLKAARDFLEPIKSQFPWISYSDLWTLAAVCAVQEMGGPDVAWRPGRQDRDVSFCTPDGRLPDGAQGQDHLRAIFGRMGFDDREIVALSGAHALGRCHTDRSGFEGPWTFSPITLTNDYYKLLLEEKWSGRKWSGPAQFQDVSTKSLMMLPTDMSLIKDKSFRPFVEKYAKDQDAFFGDFGAVVTKLFELGVPFESKVEERLVLKRSE